MSMKINSLELENVKRIKAVKIAPAENGLTVIGGNNGQGKTSVLDAIAWALGGDRFRPSEPGRDGSAIPPSLKITMANGLVVERKGKNSALTVTDPSGAKAGQTLLNEFVETLALNLPKFMEATGREKASIMLKIIGLEDELFELEKQEKALYQKRLTIGQIARQKAAHAEELPCFPDLPEEPISASELIKRQQAILAANAENERKRQNMHLLEAKTNSLQTKVDSLREQLKTLNEELTAALAELGKAREAALFLHDEPTDELERDIENVEQTNVKIRANLERAKAQEEARVLEQQYGDLNFEIEAVRKKKTDLLNGAELPLPGLSVEDGELIYNGRQWDCMSGAEQLKVATAIVRKLNPECGFVLLDKLEQMDLTTLAEFGTWLEGEGLQAIATRVSTGGECTVIIEDGYSVPAEPEKTTAALPKWGGKI